MWSISQCLCGFTLTFSRNVYYVLLHINDQRDGCLNPSIHHLLLVSNNSILLNIKNNMENNNNNNNSLETTKVVTDQRPYSTVVFVFFLAVYIHRFPTVTLNKFKKILNYVPFSSKRLSPSFPFPPPLSPLSPRFILWWPSHAMSSHSQQCDADILTHRNTEANSSQRRIKEG